MTITLTREEAQQVLDALEAEHSAIYGTSQTVKAIELLRAKLAQPEPEPVAWGVDEGEGRCISLHDLYFVKANADHMAELKGTHAKVVPLYTAPPQCEWQGLTDEEIMSLLPGAVRLPPGWSETVRAIEAKLKEKNNG